MIVSLIYSVEGKLQNLWILYLGKTCYLVRSLILSALEIEQINVNVIINGSNKWSERAEHKFLVGCKGILKVLDESFLIKKQQHVCVQVWLKSIYSLEQ